MGMSLSGEVMSEQRSAGREGQAVGTWPGASTLFSISGLFPALPGLPLSFCLDSNDLSVFSSICDLLFY